LPREACSPNLSIAGGANHTRGHHYPMNYSLLNL